jgi:hypothetical protein
MSQIDRQAFGGFGVEFFRKGVFDSERSNWAHLVEIGDDELHRGNAP